MAYQFAHIATFSRKGNSAGRSVADICAEAARLDGHAPHVDQPAPPTVLEGMDPAAIPEEIERRVAAAKRAMRGQGRGNSVRADTHVLEGAVLSHPVLSADLETDPTKRAAYEAWRADAVAWTKADAERRGLEVLSIVEHTDEAHPHVHVLSVARNARMDAKACHPGHVAEKALADGAAPAERTRAYRDAMRDWQDQHHQAVGLVHGLTRIGPGRRRLTRAVWEAEKAEAQRAAQQLADVEQAKLDAAAIRKQAEQAAAVKLREADRAAALKIQGAATKAAEIAAVADAKAEGVTLWAEGLLEPAPERKMVLRVPEAEKPALVKRLSPAWDWIHGFATKMAEKLGLARQQVADAAEVAKMAESLLPYLPAAQRDQAKALAERAAQAKRKQAKARSYD